MSHQWPVRVPNADLDRTAGYPYEFNCNADDPSHVPPQEDSEVILNFDSLHNRAANPSQNPLPRPSSASILDFVDPRASRSAPHEQQHAARNRPVSASLLDLMNPVASQDTAQEQQLMAEHRLFAGSALDSTNPAASRNAAHEPQHTSPPLPGNRDSIRMSTTAVPIRSQRFTEALLTGIHWQTPTTMPPDEASRQREIAFLQDLILKGRDVLADECRKIEETLAWEMERAVGQRAALEKRLQALAQRRSDFGMERETLSSNVRRAAFRLSVIQGSAGLPGGVGIPMGATQDFREG